MSRRQAERLLAGGGCARYPGLVALLSDAAGAARPRELSGESDAIAAFRRLRLAPPSTVDVLSTAVDVAPSSVNVVSTVDVRRPRPLRWRSTVLRLAIVVVLLAVAGTVTIKFMYLPAQMQPAPPVAPSTAPVAGSPSPSASGPAGPSQRLSPTPTGLPPTGPAPQAGSGTSTRGRGAPRLAAQQTTTGPQDAQVAEATQLCAVWTDPKTDKATRDRLAQRLRQLMSVLDGPNGLAGFCNKFGSPKVAPKTDKKGS
jgi:hypothetical protein